MNDGNNATNTVMVMITCIFKGNNEHGIGPMHLFSILERLIEQCNGGDSQEGPLVRKTCSKTAIFVS